MDASYTRNVFINCPFDEGYDPIFYAVVFAIIDCGFLPRCALEMGDSGQTRFDNIKCLIEKSKFGVHDISRTELDINNLPRFNMPLELGVFIGARKFGESFHEQKKILILDTEQYRYQKFISDISGQDIRAHANSASQAITCIRNFFSNFSGQRTIPGGKSINNRYQQFQLALPGLCHESKIQVEESTYNDYCKFVFGWLNNEG